MGTVLGIPTMIRDRSAENSAEEKFRLAVEACPSGMLMTDGDGAIVLVNTETERLFGYRRDELIGRAVEILMPERYRDRHSHHRARFADHPHVRRVESSRGLFGRRRDGSEFPVEIGLNPIRTRDGLFVLNVVIDISDRQRMDRLKDEFVATVSHELRTPLTSIAGSLDLLLGSAAGDLPQTAMRLLAIAQTNSKRLVRLINDILDIEKIESGKIVFNFKRVEACALVEQVIDSNRAYADGFGVRIRLDPAPVRGDVLVDPDRLAQVLTNLLSNAIKFSPANGEVAVAIAERAEMVRISVRDHGDGIPAEFRPRIFEKFAQADATDARQKSGTGLGLSIVREIVARLGGKVGFEDAKGGGTAFYVELPGWTQIARREFDAERTADAVRILFCEDDPDAAFALRQGLRPFGFSTDFAHSPADAIAHVRTNQYAVILIDFELPHADGVNFIRRLREQPETYKTPIVIVSGDPGRTGGEADKFNVLAWIAKPIDLHPLAELLDSAARGAHGRPCILHVDDASDVLDLVARALQATARVVSVASIEAARQALLANRFDLVVLDIAVGEVSGLDLLPYLRSRNGTPIPVIIFSAHAAELSANPQVEARLNKSRASLEDLVAAVHDRLTLKSVQSVEEFP